MKRFLSTYIIPIFCFLIVSCQDELAYNNGADSSGESGKYLSVEIDIPEVRTRAIDMTPGAPVYLQKVWIGIYDKESGRRVGGTPREENKELDLQNRLTAAGEVIKNLIPVDFYNDEIEKLTDFGNDNQLCVVGVANYDPHDNNLDIMTNKGNRLIDELRVADTWEKFKNIAIDTHSEGFVNQTPMLMGYLYNTRYIESQIYPDFVYTKIDQFKDDNKVNLICRSTGSGSEDRAEPIWVNAKVGNDGKWELDFDKADYQLRFRRMRSKINIEFVPYPGVTITGLSYQVHNQPNSAYLGQRLTDDFSQNSAMEVRYSPNSADRDNSQSEINGYTSDEDWIVPDNIQAFSFEHFENKHWVKPGYDFNNDYHQREANDLKGTFHALADSPDHWNNKASYIILKMTIEDRNTGRYADVKYVVHEGYCNNIYGTQLSPGNPARLSDYQCIRNTNYTYRIQVRGVNDIVLYVDSQNSAHPTDQGGSVWQMNYVGMYKINSDGNFKLNSKGEKIWSNQIKSYEDKEVDFSANPITFEGARVEDIAFRLVGMSKPDDDDHNPSVEPTYSDVCFNFRRGELDGFANLWPNPSENTYYLVNTDAGESPLVSLESFSNTNARKILSKILVKYEGSGGDYKNIKEYIEDIYTAKKVLPITGFKFKGLQKSDLGRYFDESDPRNNLRGLYIFDRERAILKGLRVPTDKDPSIVLGKDKDGYDIYHECSFLYEMVAAEQLPYDPDEIEEEIPDGPDKPTITFGVEDMVWSDYMVDMLSTNGHTGNHWYGGTEVGSLLYWKHKDGIKGYTIQIYDPKKEELKDGTYEKMYLSEADIERYKGFNNILTVPFTTTRYSFQTYDVWITPEFDNEKVANQPMKPLKLKDALIVQQDRLNGVTTWDFNAEPWKNLKTSDFSEKPLEYNGLMVLNTTGAGTMPNGSGNYIQFGSGGSGTDKCFWFYIHEPGTLKVTVSNTGNNEQRYLQLYQEIDGVAVLVDGTKETGTSSAQAERTYTVTPPENPEYQTNKSVHPYIPTKYILTCNNNCRYYKITFTRTR